MPPTVVAVRFPASKGSDPGGTHQDRKPLPSAHATVRDAMTFTIALIATAAFLSGSSIGILAIVASGIRSNERAKNLAGPPRTVAEAVTRRLLGVGVRTGEAEPGTSSSGQLIRPTPDRPGSSPEAS
jgi:hypothetical protein